MTVEKTRAKIKDKRILIWGYGREGKSTERFIKEYCEPAGVEVYEGPREGVEDDKYDLIFVSPGIKFEEDAPEFDNHKFTSQTEVFMEEYGPQTVGITGTKGKSTTTAMLAKVLGAASGRRTFLMGNIGRPCLDYIPDMDETSIACYELSCHQCQRLQADPHIAVFLDLYEDHLDRYITVASYFAAKAGITRRQGPDDVLYLGEEVPRLPYESKARRVVIGRGDVGNYQLMIPGDHNQFNAEFVFRIAVDEFGCEPAAVRKALSEFGGLPHRLENCGTIDGVVYYDDSISTIPEATINAVTSVANTRTVLVGGMDRNIDYDPLIAFIKKRSDVTFILAYASGKRIYESVKSCANVRLVPDLDAQVAMAREITPKGGAVVMSNAAASYGYFKNFEERGEYYKRIIRGE